MSDLVIHVPDELFACAESSVYSGLYELAEFKQGADVYLFDAPLPYRVTLANTGDALLVAGSVSGNAHTSCVRCLEPAAYDLKGEVEGYFLIPGHVGGLSQEELDEYEALPEDHDIDLEPLLRAALALAVPLMPLCSDECKGICPGCGANLNTETCTCAPAPKDTGDEFHPHPFAALKDYKFED